MKENELKDAVKAQVDNGYKHIQKVFIPAGGQGARLDPITRIFPKPLMPVGQQSMIEKIMNQYSKCGFDDFIVSVYYKANMIKAYLESLGTKGGSRSVDYILEHKPLGTIGSLSLARDMLEDTLFINNADVLVSEDFNKILSFHKENGGILTIVGCKKRIGIPYGVLGIDVNEILTRVEEKPSIEYIAITGVYVAEPQIVDYIQKDEEKDMITLIRELLEKGEKISVYTVQEEQWFDIGQWHEYKRTMQHFK